MKALVKTQKGVGHIELKDMPEPRKPGPGEVKIKIAACGICGTDIHVKHDNFPYWPPVILGHEFTGTIIEVGPDCLTAKVGDRVVAEPHTKACGVCYLCRTGNVQICPSKRSPGWGIDGAMTSLITYPEKLLHKIPDHMTFDQAALVEPTVNCVADIVERGCITPGDFVVIIGPGPIGLLAAMVCRAVGAREVLVVGTPADVKLRLAKAQELGFKTVNIAEKSALEAVQELTNGIGADLVVECSGSPKAIPGTVDLIRKLGKVCAIGLTGGKNVEIPWDKFCGKVATLYFNMSTTYASWDRAIAMIASGKLPVETLITHKAPLSQWEKVFEACENLEGLKGLLIPD